MKGQSHVPRRLTAVGTLAVCTSVLIDPPAAWAEDIVTYEVFSDSIRVANIEFQNAAGRASAEGVALPWRTDEVVTAVHAAPQDGSQVRADWRPAAAPTRWVTVRITYQRKIICQNTLDIGDAACYGITPRIS
jgi:hypothetical protein